MSVKEDTTAEAAPKNPQRRHFIRMGVATMGASAMLGLVPEGVRSTAWAAGKDTPEKTEVKVGFIPLTDCAPIVVAAEMGFDQKYGIKIVPSKESSWAGVRDKVVNGQLDAAHVLYGLVYGVQQGIGGSQKDMAVLMTLNHNGQGITLSNQMYEKGAMDGNSLKRLIDTGNLDCTFAQTFPTGTHAMWLYYWLSSHGIHPMQDLKTIVVPPPQMVANMRIGNMDGFCAGEPWNARAVYDKVGHTVATSQDVWAGHPEKVLGTTADFVQQHPNTARALIMAVLEACRYLDVADNRLQIAKLISSKHYVNAPEEIISGRFMGRYDNGIGKQWQDPNHMKFFEDGHVTFPYLSDGMWFLTQQKRWGMLKHDPDYLSVAQKVNQIGLYSEAASQLNIAVPRSPMRSARLIDGTVWDASDPRAYAASFRIKA